MSSKNDAALHNSLYFISLTIIRARRLYSRQNQTIERSDEDLVMGIWRRKFGQKINVLLTAVLSDKVLFDFANPLYLCL